MTNEKIIEYLPQLTDMHQEFLDAEHEYRNGKNKKIRDSGSRKVDNILARFVYMVEQDYELYEYLTSDKGDSYGRAIYWDELKSFKYFGRDMRSILSDIKQKINNPE
jgi:hypothetical protein